MKIAVSAMGNKLEDMIDPRFGRCAYFIIVNIENKKIKNFEALKNQGVDAMGGAGIQAAQLIAGKDVGIVISGNIGPNAFGILSQTGIKVVTGVGGISVKDGVERYLKDELKETSTPTTVLGPGRGTGRGLGRRKWQAAG